MNGVYIRQTENDDLAYRILPFLDREYRAALLPIDPDYLRRIVPLVQERIKTLSEAPDMLAYFFEETLDYDPASLIQRGMDSVGTHAAVVRAESDLASVPAIEFDHENLENILRATGEELGLSGRQFFGALRTAITGRTATPPLFEMMEVMGQERVLRRLGAAAEKLSAA